MCMCIVENFVVEYETFLSSSTDRKEEGGIVRIGRQIFGRRRNRVLDLFWFFLDALWRERDSEYIYIYIYGRRNIETRVSIFKGKEMEEGRKERWSWVYFNFKIICTIHAEKKCTLWAKVRRIYLIKVFRLKNVWI